MHHETTPDITRKKLRAQAVSLFKAGVKAADPAPAVMRALDAAPLPDLVDGRHILIAIGKAACAMMEQALRHVPPANTSIALTVTNYENARDITGCTVIAAGHPAPDENGVRAANAVHQLLADARPHDHVLCLLSGGGSALLCAPKPGLTLADKAAVNGILLSHGFDITATNLVRQHLSTLKGGGLTRAASPATVRSLIVSDVVGDDVRAIASGPTARPLGAAQEAVEVLQNRDVWAQLPASVRRVLRQNNALPPRDRQVLNTLICSNRQSIDAIAAAASAFSPTIVSDRLQGDVATAADAIVARIQNGDRGTRALIWGGETTVTITGSGKGGRNQELALRVAQGLAGLRGHWVFLSGGTDGRDGPTDAAGGLVDWQTLARLRANNQTLSAALANNDSYHALAAANDLLITGATGTNVADVQIFLEMATS